MTLEGFILVGGASSRMGVNKSQLLFSDRNAVVRIANAVSVVADPVSTVGGPAPSETALNHVTDIHPHWGALGGIEAALQACVAGWAAVVACDLPFVTPELFARLWSFVTQGEPATLDAVVPIQSDGRPQPLCALYRRELCLKKVKELIAAGEHTPRALLAAVSTRRVEFDELAELPDAEHFFLNVNTPADYERAKEILNRSLSGNDC